MRLKTRYLIGAMAVMLPATAMAQTNTAQNSGFYVQGGLGLDWARDADLSSTSRGDEVTFNNPGWFGALSLGYDFGWPRVELEGAFRSNDPDGDRSWVNNNKRAHRNFDTYSLLANVIVDLDFGFPLVPYVGAGAGMAWVDTSFGTNTNFAYQGIAGVGYSFTPNMTAFVDYRYFVVDGFKMTHEPFLQVDDDLKHHSVLAGIRYTFGAPAPAPVRAAAPPPPPPPPPPAPPPAPQQQVVRSYLVFFDFDRSNLTNEAQRIVRTAAEGAKSAQVTRINVTGHTDRAGSPAYNQRLSQRRAQAVRAELVRNGISERDIAVFARGESDPLVPTADGVREPQNRRVEIVLQ